MKTQDPIISVLLPLKNAATDIPNVQKHVTANLGDFDEVVVINDDRDRKQDQLLNDWMNSDSRVRVIRGSGTGLVHALNLGLRACKNEWVARFDGDDDYPNNRLAIQRAAISIQDVAIFGDYTFTNVDGSSLGTIPSPIFSNFTKNSLIASQRTAHPSVVFNKEAVITVGAYREQDKHVEDLSLWLRLSKVGNLKSVPFNILNYRLHSDSISASNRENILVKTKTIIQEIGMSLDNAIDCLETLLEFDNPYDGFKYSRERHLLAFRELEVFNKLLPLPANAYKELQSRRRKLLFSPSHDLAAIRLISQRQKRNKIRELWE